MDGVRAQPGSKAGSADGPTHDGTRRIVEGHLAWEVFRFGGPIAVGMALQTTFNLADAWLIAHLPPEEVSASVGALGICDQITALGTIVSFGVSTGTGVLLAKQKGANDHESIARTAWQSVLIVLLLSAVFGVIGVFGAGFLVRDLVGAKGAVADAGVKYLRVMVGGSFSIFLLLQLTSIQRALGSSKTPVSLLVLGNVLNVLLAVVFIYGDGPSPSFLSWGGTIARALHVPRMGMVGAAWATLLARGLVLVPNVLVLVRRFRIGLPPPGQRGPDLAEVRRILGVSWPTSAQFFLRITAMLVTNSLVARFFTTDLDQTASTAMGLVFRLDTMALFVSMGWGSCAQTFVGQNLGAGKAARARRAGVWAAAFGTLSSVLLVLVVYRLGESILRLFDDHAAPIALGMDYLRVVAPSYFGLGVGVVLGNGIAGAGATRTTLLVDMCVVLGAQFPLSILSVAVFHGSLHALFMCVAVTNFTSALVYAVVYARGGWLRDGAR